MSVHVNKMSNSDVEKYPGDLLSKDCSNTENIIAKANKGLGIVAQIKVILDEVSLGSHYFEVARLLRNALLINGMFTNVQVAYGLNSDQLKLLEDVDKILLQNMLKGHSKTPTEAYYLELGILPIKYIIKSSRIMFLHYILSRDENEPLAKFFEAQNLRPSKNDWCYTVKNDMADIDLEYTFDEIKMIKKAKFKKIVKSKIINAAFADLNQTKDRHSKLDNIIYNNDLELQSYFKSSSVVPDDIRDLFKFRTRMSNVKNNFKSKFKNNLTCPLSGCDEIENDIHLANCKIINSKRSVINEDIDYFDLFRNNVDEQFDITCYLSEGEKIRDELLECQEEESD